MPKAFLLIAVISSCIFFSSCKKKNAGTSASQKDSITVLYSELHDFESVADSRTDSTKAASGKVCGLVNEKIEYGFGFDKQLKQIASYKSIDEITVSFNCMMDKKYSDDVFVLSIDDTVAKKNIYWEGKGIVPAAMNAWSPVSISYKIKKEFLQPQYDLKLYIWNKGRNTFYFDDLSFSFDHKK